VTALQRRWYCMGTYVGEEVAAELLVHPGFCVWGILSA
jgi:hypothetical protein